MYGFKICASSNAFKIMNICKIKIHNKIPHDSYSLSTSHVL